MKKLKVLILIILSIFLVIGLLVLGNKILNKVGEKIVEISKQNNYKTKTLEILKEKYGEEFAIKQTGGNFGATRNTRKLVCYPVNNPNDSFNVEVERDLSEVYDEYFNRIMEHQLEDLVTPYAKEVFGDEVIVKAYLEGMFYDYSTDMDINQYLEKNNIPKGLYLFINIDKNELSYEDSEKIKIFLEKIAGTWFGNKSSISLFFIKPDSYVKVDEEFYNEKKSQNIVKFYLDKEKIITGGSFNIVNNEVIVGIEDINNELQRTKELIWE